MYSKNVRNNFHTLQFDYKLFIQKRKFKYCRVQEEFKLGRSCNENSCVALNNWCNWIHLNCQLIDIHIQSWIINIKDNDGFSHCDILWDDKNISYETWSLQLLKYTKLDIIFEKWCLISREGKTGTKLGQNNITLEIMSSFNVFMYHIISMDGSDSSF